MQRKSLKIQFSTSYFEWCQHGTNEHYECHYIITIPFVNESLAIFNCNRTKLVIVNKFDKQYNIPWNFFCIFLKLFF